MLGNLCDYALESQMDMCTSSEIATTGLVGVKAFFAASFQASIDLFLNSGRTQEAIELAFSYSNLKVMERIYQAFVRPAFKEFQSILLEEFIVYNNEFISKNNMLTAIAIIVFMILPFAVW